MSTVPVTACPHCASPSPMGSRFCGECGHSFDSAGFGHAAASPKTPNALPSSRPTPNDTMTRVSLGLAVMGFLMCGPFTAIPGFFIAMRECSAAKAAGTPSTLASMAMLINGVISLFGLLGLGLAAVVFMLTLLSGF